MYFPLIHIYLSDSSKDAQNILKVPNKVYKATTDTGTISRGSETSKGCGRLCFPNPMEMSPMERSSLASGSGEERDKRQLCCRDHMGFNGF